MDICPICRDEFKNTSDYYTLICNHKIHTKCIFDWIKIQPKCPCCRVEISFSREIEIYDTLLKINDISDNYLSEKQEILVDNLVNGEINIDIFMEYLSEYNYNENEIPHVDIYVN